MHWANGGSIASIEGNTGTSGRSLRSEKRTELTPPHAGARLRQQPKTVPSLTHLRQRPKTVPKTLPHALTGCRTQGGTRPDCPALGRPRVRCTTVPWRPTSRQCVGNLDQVGTVFPLARSSCSRSQVAPPLDRATRGVCAWGVQGRPILHSQKDRNLCKKGLK